MSLSDLAFFVLGLILAAWDWLMHKFADLSTWGHEPLSGGWALAGLIFI